MKKAVIFGAGNIGRGFAGQLFSESGYEVVFVDINMTIIDRINADKSYPLYIVSNDDQQEVIIKNVRGIDGRDMEKIGQEVKDAYIMATSVGMNALKIISRSIAAGLKVRWQSNNMDPLNIILFENMMDGDKYVREQISVHLNEEEKVLLNEKVGLIEASIGRMVPAVSLEMQEGNPAKIYVEAYSQLPVDKAGFKGEIPYVKNMVPYAPFDFYIQRKLFMHNMGHAVTAYLGYLKGYEYIWEAIGDSTIREIAGKAFDESAAAMSKEHNVSIDILIDHKNDLINRFGNKALGDTIERVGKDPIRKLNFNDRLTGAASLCEKHGIEPRHICIGIAAAFMYRFESDEASLKVQEYLENNSIDSGIKELCSLGEETAAFKLIKDFYLRLKNGEDIESLIK